LLVVIQFISLMNAQEPPPLGHAMLPYFMLADGFINFNHGSFGSTPRSVIEKQQEYVRMMEAYPDMWFRQQYRAIIEQVRAQMSAYVNADEAELVLVENASSGVNSVLRALNLQQGDTVITLSTAYSMVTNTLTYLTQREGINVIQVPITFPTSADAIIQAVKDSIPNNHNIKLAVFDHISSAPSVLIPIQQLVEVAHSANIPVLIDGAHALGSITIDIKAIGADYYVANAHKWLYSPKGTAFLWVSRSLQSVITPTVISSENRYGITPFSDKYEYTGTRDYTAFCSISAAFEFRNWIGEERIKAYIHDLIVAAGNELATLWETEVLTDDSLVGPMVNVRLPTYNASLANNLTNDLFEQYKMYIVVIPLKGGFWTRLSGQVYLELNDFIKMGAIVKQMLSE